MTETITLKSGATLQVPEGCQIQRIGNENQIIKLGTPDKAIDLFLLETEGSNLEQAIEAGWKKVSLTFDKKMSATIKPPAPPGYDDFVVQKYASDEETFIQASARRKNDIIWVFLICGSKMIVNKRDAQIFSFIGSLKIPGMIEENLSLKPRKSIKENRDPFDHFITHGMGALNVPGLSIAIVEDGEIVFEKGYGVKKWGEQGKVDEHTLMKIASITKSMTTLLMAKLVEDGKFDWHTKAQEIYPSFRVDDAILSKTLEMEQLASASTGLPRKDLPIIFNYKGRDVFQQLATTKPTTKVKETFQYNNQMVGAAGYISAHAVYPKKSMDQAFCDVMAEKVFNPIGMTRTTFVPRENFAFPHSETLDRKIQLLTLEDDEGTDFDKPAGGIWSSAHDMGLYLITELKGGINSTGKRIFDEHNFKYRRAPQIRAGYDAEYGLGWGITKKKGLTQIGHDGGTSGFKSLLGFYPEKQCGFVILTNGFWGHFLTDVIRRKLLELWFDTDEKSSEMLKYNIQEMEKIVAEFKEKLSEPPSDLIKSFLGKHKNDELGIFEIRQDGGDYILDIGIYKTKLMIHEEKNGEKTLAWITPPYIGFSLIPSEGESFKMVEGQHTYVFKKIG